MYICLQGAEERPQGNQETKGNKMNEATITAKEALLNTATLTYSEVQEIGHDTHDAWWALLAMYGFCDPRILAGYSFEAEAAFAGFFA